MISEAQATLLEWGKANPGGRVEGRTLRTAYALERRGYLQFTELNTDTAAILVTWEGEEALSKHRRRARTELRISTCRKCGCEFTWRWQPYCSGEANRGPSHCLPCELEASARSHIAAAANLRSKIPDAKASRDRGVATLKERARRAG